MSNEIKFFYNGIKANGYLHKGAMMIDRRNGDVVRVRWISDSYTIHTELREYFRVDNDTDIYTDYFDVDSITFYPGDPYFKEALQAGYKYELHNAKLRVKQRDRRGTYDKYPDLYSRDADLTKIAELEKLAA